MSETAYSEYVVLVDQSDRELGVMEKLDAHRNGGVLHRAISVCLFDEEGRWLLQKRALVKYHSPGRIANTCCSHPRLNEAPLDAAIRRLQEELNIERSASELKHISTFVYREEVGHGMTEHELDHVFVGTIAGPLPSPNPEEVQELIWLTTEEIRKKLEEESDLFAPWFAHIFREVENKKEL